MRVALQRHASHAFANFPQDRRAASWPFAHIWEVFDGSRLKQVKAVPTLPVDLKDRISTSPLEKEGDDC